MTAESRRRLIEQLIIDEGMRLHAYEDSVGKWTIGVGRNISDNGISREEALMLLDHDVDRAIADVEKALPWVLTLDPVRQQVLVNMAFNLGIAKLLKFPKTLACIERGDYEQAAQEMGKSLWARQTKDRAVRLAQRMREGTPV